MKIAIGKLSKKYQATIPASVRQLLHLDAGNEIAFDIEGDEVPLRKTRLWILRLRKAWKAQ